MKVDGTILLTCILSGRTILRTTKFVVLKIVLPDRIQQNSLSYALLLSKTREVAEPKLNFSFSKRPIYNTVNTSHYAPLAV